ncbi:hypothetical protein FGG79_12475 [Bacillus sp. BHET2]|uniref:hypothetical protein n=1 Tax=Bacillus sp. BHET2 TaxID=2583818 RepID=UPI00110F5097|nr:hypothetical protein [Bacillus sp. BHET2]TMU85995.1 hypothetical protein FGG79_12475 [Bacillus sp. BHET2]
MLPYIAIGRIIQVSDKRYPNQTVLYLVSASGDDELPQGRISLKTALELGAKERICNVYAPS